QQRAAAGEERIEYSSSIYHEMMSTYASHGAPEKAEEMLDELCQTVLDGTTDNNQSNLEVNSRSMNMVLSAWARANNPDRAEAILKRMIDYRDRGLSGMAPIAMNYMRVIECWNRSSSSNPLAGERADDLLKLMENDAQRKSKTHMFLANKGLYLAVMKRLAQFGSGERAGELLRRVQSLFEDEKSNTAIDQFLYREAILAWKNSTSPNAAARSEVLEQELLQRFFSSQRSSN
ncbi:Pentatricopeptide repeat-containing protein (Partial), partial [Seminavis robusta]